VADRRMWGEMRMNPTDLLDVSGYTYTYLMNGVAPAGNWTGLFNRGERLRLRFINGSAMSFFDVRDPGFENDRRGRRRPGRRGPVTVDEFRIGTAEVLDVMVEPSDERAYTIFAQSMDRSAYARGTLATARGHGGGRAVARCAGDSDHDRHGHGPWRGCHGAMPGMAGMDHGRGAAMDHGDKADMNHDGMAGMQYNAARPLRVRSGRGTPQGSSARPWTCGQIKPLPRP